MVLKSYFSFTLVNIRYEETVIFISGVHFCFWSIIVGIKKIYSEESNLPTMF